MEKRKYNITGMSCSACSSRVQKAVSELPGIDEAQVNLLTNSMMVEGSAVDPDIVAAVEAAGYGCVPEAASSEKGSTETAAARRKNVAEEEMAEMKGRIIWSVVFTLPLFLIAMGPMIGLPLPAVLTGMENASVYALTQFLLCLPVVVINRKYYKNGFKSLWHRSPNMDSLIAVGSGAALAYGIFVLFALAYGQGHGDMALVERYHHDLYFDSAAMILTLITFGKWLEARAKGKTSDALNRLIDLTPQKAVVLRDGREMEIPADQVAVGDLVAVKPGTAVPVDGVVVSGVSAVDESAITGESLPVDKAAGDPVTAATINTNGYLEVRAEKVGDATAFAGIIRLVEEASATKAPIARLADRIAGVFVPVVMSIALVTAIVWLLAGAGLTFALSTGIAVLVISCPCALGLATPVAIMVGTGVGAQHGILYKSGDALERASKADTVVMDKTGTLTSGVPVVTDVWSPAGDFLPVARALEKASSHPLAGAVMAYDPGHPVADRKVTDFANMPGLGVQGVVDGRTCMAGSVAMMVERGFTDPAYQAVAEGFAREGKTPLVFADEGSVLGIIAVADTLKPDSAAAVSRMKAMGLDLVMLTGDNPVTAEAIRRKAGIDAMVAGVLPADKERTVRELGAADHHVIMVGDGINDAPALASADIGMAIGAGTDVAIESADVVLTRSSLMDVGTAIDLSRAVIRNIKENLFWAFFYNCIGIPIAAGALYPAFGIRLSPMIGALAMSFSSVFVVTNALRLRRFKASPVPASVPGGTVPAETAVKADGDGLAPSPEGKMKELTAIADNSGDENSAESSAQTKEEFNMKTVKVEGMMCAHCVAHVKEALEAIPGVRADVDLDSGTAKVESDGPVADEALTQAVVGAGYQVTGIE